MRRARRSRVRRVGKWAGLVVVLVLVGMWGVSEGRWVLAQLNTRCCEVMIGCELGTIVLACCGEDSRESEAERFSFTTGAGPSLQSLTYRHWLPEVTQRDSMVVIDVPMWMPLVLVGGLTGWLWWRDARAVGEGCCRGCGYDLAGIGDVVCPECGRRA